MLQSVPKQLGARTLAECSASVAVLLGNERGPPALQLRSVSLVAREITLERSAFPIPSLVPQRRESLVRFGRSVVPAGCLQVTHRVHVLASSVPPL